MSQNLLAEVADNIDIYTYHTHQQLRNPQGRAVLRDSQDAARYDCQATGRTYEQCPEGNLCEPNILFAEFLGTNF